MKKVNPLFVFTNQVWSNFSTALRMARQASVTRKPKGESATHPPLGQPYPGLPTLVFRPGSLTKRDPAALTANPNDLSFDNCRPNPSRHPGVQPVPMEALDRRGWRLLGREARGPHLREPG